MFGDDMLRLRKIVTGFLVVALAVTMCSCTKPENKVVKSDPKIIFVTDIGGLGDGTFNDSIWNACENAADKYSVDIRCLESKTDSDIKTNIDEASNEEPSLVVACGATAAKVIKGMSKDYPDVNYTLVDNYLKRDNVFGIVFKEQEGSFLAGVAAAMKTETNTVGFIGGKKIASIQRFYYGYLAGVKSVDENVKVVRTYTGSFNNKVDGMKAAKLEYAKGADVIFAAAGYDGTGVIKYAGLKNFSVIGVDKDQSSLDKEHVLCSMTKNINDAVCSEIRDASKDKFKAGEKVYTLKENGLELSDKAGNLTQDMKTAISKWSQAIKSGQFTVPYSKSTYASFKIPKLK